MSVGASLAEVAALTDHSDRVWHCAWSPDGSVLATTGGDRAVRLYSEQPREDGSVAWTLVDSLSGVHTKTVRATAWRPDGKMLAAASFDGVVSIWAQEKAGEGFECVNTLEGHEHEVKSVAWNPAGTMLATCSRDKSVWVWSVEDDGDFECMSVLNGHTQDVKAVRWHPHDRVFVSCSYDDTLRFWALEADEDDFAVDTVLTGHTSTVWACAFDRTGKRMVSSSDDCNVIIWERIPAGSVLGNKEPEWRAATTLSGYHSRSVYSCDWLTALPAATSDGGVDDDDHDDNNVGLIATGGGDDAVCVFGLDASRDAEATGQDGTSGERYRQLLRHEGAHRGDVNCVAWNPKRWGVLATAGDDNTVRIWKFTEETA